MQDFEHIHTKSSHWSGPSGEGKTTMLRLILSLLKPQTGTAVIYADSESEHCELPLTPSARKLFSYVPQGNTMFSGTIAENMRIVKPDATDEEIILALKQACAWEFVEKLPNTINSSMKERGGGFSEGQAQRLSIARAMLRKSLSFCWMKQPLPWMWQQSVPS